jgi:hypothetical protein
MSTLYLSIKYHLDSGNIVTVKGDQALARHCYESSMKITHKAHNNSPQKRTTTDWVNMVSTSDLDPIEEFQDIWVSPIKELEQVQIGE